MKAEVLEESTAKSAPVLCLMVISRQLDMEMNFNENVKPKKKKKKEFRIIDYI